MVEEIQKSSKPRFDRYRSTLDQCQRACTMFDSLLFKIASYRTFMVEVAEYEAALAERDQQNNMMRKSSHESIGNCNNNTEEDISHLNDQSHGETTLIEKSEEVKIDEQPHEPNGASNGHRNSPDISQNIANPLSQDSFDSPVNQDYTPSKDSPDSKEEGFHAVERNESARTDSIPDSEHENEVEPQSSVDSVDPLDHSECTDCLSTHSQAMECIINLSTTQLVAQESTRRLQNLFSEREKIKDKAIELEEISWGDKHNIHV